MCKPAFLISVDRMLITICSCTQVLFLFLSAYSGSCGIEPVLTLRKPPHSVNRRRAAAFKQCRVIMRWPDRSWPVHSRLSCALRSQCSCRTRGLSSLFALAWNNGPHAPSTAIAPLSPHNGLRFGAAPVLTRRTVAQKQVVKVVSCDAVALRDHVLAVCRLLLCRNVTKASAPSTPT
jgi:hypothetical protein